MDQKLWYVYTTEYHAAERKKQLLPFATAWMELESIMLRVVSQEVKDRSDLNVYMGRQKIQNIQHNNEREEQRWRTNTAQLQDILERKSKNCGTFIQWNTMQQKERITTFCNSTVGTGIHYSE